MRSRPLAREVMNDTLADEVHALKTALAVDVCSVHLAEQSSAGCVLRATDGLEPRAVGAVHFEPHEGLVGTVFATGLPLRLDNAEQHPRFRKLPQFGENQYRAFLGVPIARDGQVLGTLSVRQIDRRDFTRDEEQTLAKAAARLARLIALGPSPGSTNSPPSSGPESRLVSGVPGAPGIDVGVGVLPSPAADLDSVPDRACADVTAEEDGFMRAVEAVRAELRASAARLASVVPTEAHAMFRVYAELLDDEQLFAGAIERIRAGQWAPGALRQTIAEHARVFEVMDDPYLRARSEDLRGLGRRVLLQLQAGTTPLREYPNRCVLVGEEVSIARIADVPIERLAGVVCLRGSPFSHAAILARTLRIPAVMGVQAGALGSLGGRRLLVDGDRAQVVVDPGPLALEEWHRAALERRGHVAELAKLRDLPAQTLDGVDVTLHANVGLASDVGRALASGAQGVGLYRSEFAFMARDSFPGEDEQAETYRQVLQAFAPRPVTMRSLDIGSDKGLPYFPVDEDNPALGWRGIRLTLDNPGVFLTQLRAMLRANAGLGNLRLLFPMVTSVDEIDAACALLRRAQEDVALGGQEVHPISVGAMIEVPAALYQLPALAKRVDFFSFGTNDLTQYLLAVDRNNARVASRYDSLHPAVLRAIEAAVITARELDKPVSVCGDMAADPAAAVLLLGMGITSLSVAPVCLGDVKLALRGIQSDEARQWTQRAMSCESAREVHALMADARSQTGAHKGGAASSIGHTR